MVEIELKPCPDCNGEVKIYANIMRGAYAVCLSCKKEFDICGMDKIPLYQGCKFRKATADKIRRMWNKMTHNNEKGEEKCART